MRRVAGGAIAALGGGVEGESARGGVRSPPPPREEIFVNAVLPGGF